jgi:hypothetical protein
MTPTNVVHLFASSPIGLRAQALAAAEETIRFGRRLLVIDVDNLASSDDGVRNALAAAGRRLQEAGSALSVRFAGRSPCECAPA